jgi:hypothetical protein
MIFSATTDKPILKVTEEEADYFRHYKPLHYLTLQEMIRHGEALIIEAEMQG